MGNSIIKVFSDGKVKEITNPILNLEFLRDSVGGDIEAVMSGSMGITVYLNENGKSMDLPENKKATEFCHRHQLIFDDDFIAGDVVIVGYPDDEGNDTLLSIIKSDAIINELNGGP